MYPKVLISTLTLFLTVLFCNAQVDSIETTLFKIPDKFFSQTSSKIDKYNNRLTGKTNKTLEKLARWENKIKTLLDKTSPATSAKLFGNNQLTFNVLLQKIKQGETISQNYKAQYNSYRDKLTTGLKYIEQQKTGLEEKYIKPAQKLQQKLESLENDVAQTEIIEKFITERKKQLLEELIKQLGKNKYLAKINKEAYYYSETLRNYKEIFNDRKKAEQTALGLIEKVPAFKEFFRKNSMLSSMFKVPLSTSNPSASLAGLQTRDQVTNLIQQQIASGGPNAMAEVKQNIQKAQAELNKLKDKILKMGGNSSNANIPDFKPNTQKTKTFAQRLEYGFNLQFDRSSSLLPSAANFGLSIGYKLNDKSIIGIGGSYRLGMGRIDKIEFSYEGAGIRSYLDWKLKKQFYLSGGFEMNHYPSVKGLSANTINGVKPLDSWQQSGLLGVSKKFPMKTKFTKGAKLQLLWDFLHRQHIPVSQALLFRIGYNF